MAHVGALPQLHRYITGHDSNGKAVFSTKIPEQNVMKENPDGIAFALGYTTKGFPADLNNDADLEVYKGFMENAPGLTVSNGTVLRFVDIPPKTACTMHRTISLDYGVVLEGEVELLLDSGEQRMMRRGDSAIQRATMHQWINPSSTEWVRMLFVLQPCQPLELVGKTLGEELDNMAGVRASD